MTRRTPTSDGAKPPAGESRDDRLKAALKANLARRKAQARARAGGSGAEDAAGPNDTPGADDPAGQD